MVQPFIFEAVELCLADCLVPGILSTKTAAVELHGSNEVKGLRLFSVSDSKL